MNIEPWMINIEELEEIAPSVAELAEKRLPRYMVYPKGGKAIPFVMQSHRIGKAQHMDFRFKLDAFLQGWTIVGGSIEERYIEDEITPKKLLEAKGKGFRAEEKATQPVVWLEIDTPEIEPGEVGGGVEAKGQMIIMTSGECILGAQKPAFHEYFLKSDYKVRKTWEEIQDKVEPDKPREEIFGGFKDWTRLIIRGVRVPKIDPVTKLPTGKYETMWRAMIPIEQMPYAISERGMRKGWVPPYKAEG